ncbi:triose-phosphate isomerase [Bernardetia sp.]|uniref:triose-phosphate isomerase n=1 Tax=Bernardetia sp. TaxID=1937974 RepID=UPI0025B7C6F4|nr:triose-phosphate isomerase [Bernardetia sp.]
MRQKIVAGNWKMNLIKEEAQSLTAEIVGMSNDELGTNQNGVKLILCPSFVHISTIKSLFKNVKNVHLGAQNVASQAEGAYTGEVSAEMLVSYQVEYVIIGHSERRQYFKETNQEIAQKIDLIFGNGMLPIFCCGETLELREEGNHIEFIKNQISESLFHLPASKFEKVVIAYEPIWAIGTGKTASSEQAQEIHAAIREHIASKYGQEIADKTPILYGGSCKPSNAKELFACADVDGGLIGGAALKSRDFIEIAKSF